MTDSSLKDATVAINPHFTVAAAFFSHGVPLHASANLYDLSYSLAALLYMRSAAFDIESTAGYARASLRPIDFGHHAIEVSTTNPRLPEHQVFHIHGNADIPDPLP